MHFIVFIILYIGVIYQGLKLVFLSDMDKNGVKNIVIIAQNTVTIVQNIVTVI